MLQEFLQVGTRHVTIEFICSIHELTQVLQPGLRFRRPFRLELCFIPRTCEHLTCDIGHSHVRDIAHEATHELAKRL